MAYPALNERAPARPAAPAVADPCIPGLAVVVPAYRETRLLPATLATMPDFVDHIIVVDDGSPDDTYEVAVRESRLDPRINVIRLGFNAGVGRAITRGYQRALELGCRVVAVMAADNQMDPADLRRVVEPVLDGEADYVKGNRLAHPDSAQMPRIRRLGTTLLGTLTGLVGGVPGIVDSQCGYTAISARMLEALPLDALFPRYGYPNDLILRLAEQGARIAQPVVRPVYAGERSDLRIPAVVGPIGGILLRGLWRRLRDRLIP